MGADDLTHYMEAVSRLRSEQEKLRGDVAHVLRHGKLGKQSRRRLKKALSK